MAKKNEIEIVISGDIVSLRKSINQATAQVSRFGRDLKTSLSTAGGQQFASIGAGFTVIGAAATAAAVGGLYLFTNAMLTGIEKASQFSTAAFLMGSSLDAANRQFDVGSAAEWDKTIQSLSESLRVYSEKELRNAAAKTIDMTKRLGMNAEQMKKIIQISGDLSAGKTSIVDGVERVTAALRGEAEASEMLGLTLNEDYVKGWYGASKATGKAWKDLTDVEKAQQRLNILLEQAGPKAGQAAASMGTYASQLQTTKNSFEGLQEEVGGLFIQNTFVIESLKILSAQFTTLQEAIAGNRNQFASLVKDGVLLFLDSIVIAGETLRFFYNGWQGLGLVAHGAVVLIVKGMELVTTATRNVLKPLDLMLTGLAKIGVIDSNPLKNFEETLKGFGEVSLDDFNSMLDGVSAANEKFDQGKAIVEAFKAKIAEIPAQYKTTAEQIKGDTEKVNQEIKQLGDGTFTNRFEKDKVASKESAESQKQDAQAIGDAWRKLDDGTYTNRFEKDKAASNASTESQKQDVREIETAWKQLENGTFTNRTQEEANAFKAMAESQKQDIKSVGDAHSEFVTQALKNIAFLEAEAEKGNLSEAALGKLEVLKERLAEILAESAESQKKGIEEVAGSTEAIGEGFKSSFDEAVNESYQATAKILSDINKIKKEAASIKYATPTSSKADGYATGGDPFFGGLRGYGGGDRRIIMVEDGEHVIRKEAVARLGHGFFQRFNGLNFPRLPKFATGGPVAAGATAGSGSAAYNITLNYSGGGSRSDAKTMADMVMSELQRRYRRSS